MLAAIILILGVFSAYANNTLSPYMVEISENKARTMVNEALNQMLIEEFGGKIRYSELAVIQRDSRNRITSIEVNTVKLNELTSRITSKMQNSLEAMKEERIAVPVGALSGIPIFSAEGPDVYIKIIPAGNVEVEFVSDFASEGANQTRHRIFLEVRARVGLTVPLITKETNIVTNIPVAETIIVGNVPEPYISAWKPMSN